MSSLRITVAAVSALIASVANATLISGFEEGRDGWESVGDVSLQSADFGTSPSEGLWQAVITTLCDSTVVSWCEGGNEIPYSGISSLPDTDTYRASLTAAGFLGLPTTQEEMFDSFDRPPSTVGRGESGALTLSFFASAGDLLAFDWNFISMGPDGVIAPMGFDNDSAYFSLWSDSTRYSDLLRDRSLPEIDFRLSGVDLCARLVHAFCNSFRTYEAGYATRFVPIEADGWYSLGFALLETAEGTIPSALAIDNVRIVNVPEPSDVSLLLMSLLSLGLLSRFSRSRKLMH